jgi:hypothetical protein
VFALSSIEGYENIHFNLGEKTWIIDEDFFGSQKQEEVIITEISELLDDPSQDQLSV